MQVRHWLLALALWPLSGLADEESQPSLELLEYLGEWQEVAGEEIDPQDLALLQAAVEQGGGSDEE